ncbi:MAG: DUF2721 domain-containing protein [Terriglobales bacterium]
MFYPIAENPFAVLTAVVAPAILTNASSVLSLGTGNRLARVVDRTRAVMGQLAAMDSASAEHRAWTMQLEGLRVRSKLLVTALRNFYAALGLFAASALISVVGSISAYFGEQLFFEAAAALAIVTGAAAVIGLSWGCALMVRETRLAVQNLAEEVKIGSRA